MGYVLMIFVGIEVIGHMRCIRRLRHAATCAIIIAMGKGPLAI